MGLYKELMTSHLLSLRIFTNSSGQFTLAAVLITLKESVYFNTVYFTRRNLEFCLLYSICCGFLFCEKVRM